MTVSFQSYYVSILTSILMKSHSVSFQCCFLSFLSFQRWIRKYNETTYMSEIALNELIENNTEMALSKQLSFMSFHLLSF